MPYIKDPFRLEMGIEIDTENISRYLSSLPDEAESGAINYLNYKIAKKTFERKGKKYYRFAWWAGTMLLCIFEVWWRMIRVYEDEKIKENGDVT